VRSGGDGIDCLGVSGMDHERFNLGAVDGPEAAEPSAVKS